jgi:hypothetical protein
MAYISTHISHHEVIQMEKQHFEILLENVDSNVKLLLEGFCGLNNKIDAVRVELKEDISLLDHKIIALSNRVSSVETNLSKRMDGIDSRLDGIDGRLDGIDGRLDGIDGRLDGIDGRLDVMHGELIAHRNSTELHKAPQKREIRKAA